VIENFSLYYQNIILPMRPYMETLDPFLPRLFARQNSPTLVRQGQNVGDKPANNMAKITKAAEEFEANFLAQMLQPMFATLETDTVFGGGHGEEMFRGEMVNEYARLMMRNGGIGIAAKVKAEMLKSQEAH
jgi:peptidoglycan hydrolase FlgJ